jgi:hypothetical protein
LLYTQSLLLTQETHLQIAAKFGHDLLKHDMELESS